MLSLFGGDFGADRETDGREIGENKLDREKEEVLNLLCAKFG